MAEMLKTRYGLLALKVALDAVRGEPTVEFTVERHRLGEAMEPFSVQRPLDGLGVPEELVNGPTPPFDLPADLVEQLLEALQHADPDEPLWLHLVKPYGHLGALPWERVLLEATGRPVVRLPDFLESPREDKSMLEAAIICDLDFDQDPAMGPAFCAVLSAWLAASGRERVRVHVFASNGLPCTEAWAADERVVLHPPGLLEGCEAPFQDPWSYWIGQGLDGRALDAIHLICRADVSNGRSTVALSRPYGRDDHSPITFVSPSELASGLAQTGAWCLVATGPPDGSCDAALRHFVDSVAQARPGPALFHRFEKAAIERELCPAFATLFSDWPGEPAPLRDAFLYCQPDLVMRNLEAMPPSATAPVDHNADLFASGPASAGPEADDAGSIPNWVAAAQRFAETAALDACRVASGDVLMRDLLKQELRGDQSKSEASAKTVLSTLDRLQRIVGEVAKDHYSGGSWKK
jgi:hypothetical protein